MLTETFKSIHVINAILETYTLVSEFISDKL